MRVRLFHLLGSCALLLGCGDAGRIDSACESNADCTESQICATGICEGGIGICNERPTSCGDTESPVCGCDGRTYPNQCLATMAGVRLATGSPCICADNSACVTGQYCALPNSCGNSGLCLDTPETCDPSDTQEVCACDGVTYANECEAAQSGARVSALGSCECASNSDCGASEYCNAITCDGPGVCEAPPVACTPGSPVTGCDGASYDSACDAASAGVRVRPES